jgi:hypothetical protein
VIATSACRPPKFVPPPLSAGKRNRQVHFKSIGKSQQFNHTDALYSMKAPGTTVHDIILVHSHTMVKTALLTVTDFVNSSQKKVQYRMFMKTCSLIAPVHPVVSQELHSAV